MIPVDRPPWVPLHAVEVPSMSVRPGDVLIYADGAHEVTEVIPYTGPTRGIDAIIRATDDWQIVAADGMNLHIEPREQ